MVDLFILGCFRSGTSLLRTRLTSSPEVFIPEETKFLTYLIDNFDKKEAPIEVHKIISRQGWEKKISLDRIRHVFKQETEIQEIFWNISLTHCSNLSNIKVRGDKTPYYAKIYKKITMLFPKAKIIYLLRDGRDVFASVKNLHIGYARTPIIAAAYWHHRSSPSVNHQNTYILKYEDFVKSPKDKLASVCKFLGINFSEEMLSSAKNSDAAKLSRQPHHKKVSKKIFLDSVSSFENKLSKFEIYCFELYAYKRLDNLGYKLNNSMRLLNLTRFLIPILFLFELPYAVYKTFVIRANK